ncbi:hypothetical protein C0991_008699 [Blastosporella zonata]|nr:hypothetical protein C0991_008699 [Blastosporella zonata]
MLLGSVYILSWGFFEMLCVILLVWDQLGSHWIHLGHQTTRAKLFREDALSWQIDFEAYLLASDEAQQGREAKIWERRIEEEEKFRLECQHRTEQEERIREDIFNEGQEIKQRRLELYLKRKDTTNQEETMARAQHFEDWKAHVLLNLRDMEENALDVFLQDQKWRLQLLQDHLIDRNGNEELHYDEEFNPRVTAPHIPGGSSPDSLQPENGLE